MTSERFLCVDDEPNVLEAYQRALRKEFRIETALGGTEGLRMIAERGPYAVIISDMRMPEMDGVQFLSQAKEAAPDSVRMMLTGNADQQTAIEAVNEGHIFRFLNKPCPPEVLAQALTDGLHQYRLLKAEKDLLEQTLRGAVKVLADLLSIVNPTAFGRASRTERLAGQLARALKAENLWQIEVAAMLSQIGCLTFPEETLIKVAHGKALGLDEVRMLQSHPKVGADLISHIPRLESVAEIIAYQELRYQTASHSDEPSGAGIPLGSRILKVALDFDKLIKAGATDSEALEEVRRRQGWYDEAVVAALQTVLENERQYEPHELPVGLLTPGMIIAQEVIATTGLLLMPKGLEVTHSHLARLSNFFERGLIQKPVSVLIPVR